MLADCSAVSPSCKHNFQHAWDSVKTDIKSAALVADMVNSMIDLEPDLLRHATEQTSGSNCATLPGVLWSGRAGLVPIPLHCVCTYEVRRKASQACRRAFTLAITLSPTRQPRRSMPVRDWCMVAEFVVPSTNVATRLSNHVRLQRQ